MSFDQRIIVYSAQDEFLFELSPRDVLKAVMVEEINAEHSLTLALTRSLEKEQRLLTQDKTGKWREFVVTGCSQSRGSGGYAKEYKSVWSLQHDLVLFKVDTYIEEEDAVTAQMALGEILSFTSRWGVGTVNLTTTAGADLTQTNGWAALSKLVGSWGGEVDATIVVGADGVTERRVDLLRQVGETVARRRFDYSKDMTQISRKVDESPIACRVRPYGKSENTIDGIRVKLTIEDVNGGRDYLQNDDVAYQMRFPDGVGGYEYPTIDVENSSIDDDELLMEWGESVLPEYTTPTITYEATVTQYEEAGTSAFGLALGDAVQCVDTAFFDGSPLRLESRVRRIERDLLDAARTVIRIGNPKEALTTSISSAVNRINSAIDTIYNAFETTSDYLRNILSNLNDAINATGGYAYVTDGEGLVTYDIAVDDPLIGYNAASQAWASKVVQIKGGSIRIADTKRSGFVGINDWDWKTVFVSGHVASELVTAANIVTGFIGSSNGGNYWNLDTGELRIVPTALIGERTFSELIQEIDATITSVDVQYAQNQSSTVPPESGWSTTAPVWQSGYYIWQRTATTAADGISYSSPVCISGREGRDGTSVTILGSYNSLAELQAAHPSGNVGDGYIVTGDLYVWNGTTWENVGTIQGPAGANGANGYVHIAWANSADGSVGFSTSTAVDKSYVGMYTDNSQTASQQYVDYSWSKIRGADGDDGVGITSIVEQYYLSTSDSTQTGGSWSTTQPTWQTGRYIWTRSEITWDTTPATVTHTTPILAQALTQANELAKTASDKADSVDTSLTNLQTQQAIFNLLTNNGTLEGLYMQNNRLYINASYIKTGYLGDSISGNCWNFNDGTLRLVGTPGGTSASTHNILEFSTLSVTDVTGWINGTTTAQNLDGLDVRYGRVDGTGNISGYNHIYFVPNLDIYSGIIASNSLKILSRAKGNNGSAYKQVGMSLGNTTSEAFRIDVMNDTQKLCYMYFGGSSFQITSSTYGSIMSLWFNTSTQSTFNTAIKISGSLSVTGTKSRLVDSDSYGSRLMYSYETAEPLFGDVGSGVTDDDGICVVAFDDIFYETVSSQVSYQVFLQKCGSGDLWVSEKHSTYFVVSGSRNLPFDWEVKCKQRGYEPVRLENEFFVAEEDAMADTSEYDYDEIYQDEILYATSIEELYS